MEPEKTPEKALEKKLKKKKSKKSKKPLIITLIIVGVLLVAGLVYYFFFFSKGTKIVLSDSDYLIETKSWEKVDAPTVIWVFNENGKGELTTNKSNYYDTTWSLKGSTLEISTEWLYDLNDSFEISIDRGEKSFTVKNLSDETESKFVPLGTQAEQTSDQLENTEEKKE